MMIRVWRLFVHHVLQSVNKIDIRCALYMCPQPEINLKDVTEAWGKVVAANGLPIDFVDDPFVRAAITMAARAGLVYIDGSPVI